MSGSNRNSAAKELSAAGTDAPAPVGWTRPAPISTRSALAIAAVVVAVNLPLIHYFFLRGPAEVKASIPFQDDYSSAATIAKNYFSTGGLWRVENGQLLSPGVKNNPLWLAAALPANVAVEFDVRSQSPEGDIKAEIFGDGINHASGYVLIHGGWNNSVSIIARLDEHGPSLGALQADAQRRGQRDLVQSGVFRRETRMRVEAHPYPVQVGRTYHWKIERKGTVLVWSIDGTEFMRFDDPYPLTGPGHDRFGFSSWESQLFFDNLKIEAR